MRILLKRLALTPIALLFAALVWYMAAGLGLLFGVMVAIEERKGPRVILSMMATSFAYARRTFCDILGIPEKKGGNDVQALQP